jgi:hypothetical protein
MAAHGPGERKFEFATSLLSAALTTCDRGSGDAPASARRSRTTATSITSCAARRGHGFTVSEVEVDADRGETPPAGPNLALVLDLLTRVLPDPRHQEALSLLRRFRFAVPPSRLATLYLVMARCSGARPWSTARP